MYLSISPAADPEYIYSIARKLKLIKKELYIGAWSDLAMTQPTPRAVRYSCCVAASGPWSATLVDTTRRQIGQRCKTVLRRASQVALAWLAGMSSINLPSLACAHA